MTFPRGASENEMQLERPRPPAYMRKVAWVQLITGIIVCPVCLVAIFL
jgi:hypothetical protein